MCARFASDELKHALRVNSKSETQDPKRILVRGVNWLGDAVMTIPALLRLRERFPEAQIAVLAPDKLAEFWLHCPAVNETIAFSANEGVFGVSRKLREKRFDLLVVFPNSPRSAIEGWLARIPRRIGYARPLRNLFLTSAVPPRIGAVKMRKRSASKVRKLIASIERIRNPHSVPQAAPQAHQIYDYLHLAAALGANPEPLPPELFVASDEIETAKKKFGIDTLGQPILGVNPGAEYGPAKRWPIDRFVAAAREIQNKTSCVWLIFGGRGDMEIARHVEEGIRNSLAVPQHSEGVKIENRNLAGQTSLRELTALLKCCRVLLTNDSGPMHLAAALGTPVVVPFGSTSPELTGPGYAGANLHRILRAGAPCSPCFLRECPIDFRCMKGIGVEQVVAAVSELACSS